jgi:hypothetical protein
MVSFAGEDVALAGWIVQHGAGVVAYLFVGIRQMVL